MHVLVAESALGRYLPAGVEVHHVDGNTTNNRGSNLVICQDKAYHKLLHVRARVVGAGGDPDSDRVCSECRRAKPMSAFHRMRSRVSGGRQSRCIDCQRTLDEGRSRSLTRAVSALVALLLAAPASAAPILPPQPSAVCVLEQIQPEHPYIEDKGWDWLQQLLGLSDAEIDARKAEDKLHEPEPEAPVFAWKCPGGCQHGGPNGESAPVPEPSLLSLLAFGAIGLLLRRRG